MLRCTLTLINTGTLQYSLQFIIFIQTQSNSNDPYYYPIILHLQTMYCMHSAPAARWLSWLNVPWYHLSPIWNLISVLILSSWWPRWDRKHFHSCFLWLITLILNVFTTMSSWAYCLPLFYNHIFWPDMLSISAVHVFYLSFTIPVLLFSLDEQSVFSVHFSFCFALSPQAVLEKPAAVGADTATKVEKTTVAAVCKYSVTIIIFEIM